VNTVTAQKNKLAQAQQQAVQTLESQKGGDGAAPDAKRPRGRSLVLVLHIKHSSIKTTTKKVMFVVVWLSDLLQLGQGYPIVPEYSTSQSCHSQHQACSGLHMTATCRQHSHKFVPSRLPPNTVLASAAC
jgi:hypothetical protein